MGRWLWGAVVAIAFAGGMAEADPGPTAKQATAFELQAELDARAGHKRSLSRHFTDKLTLWSNEMGSHVNLLTLDLVDMKFDVRKRHANIRVGTLTPNLGLRVDGKVRVRSNVARIRSSVAIGVNGQVYRLELPLFEVATQDISGNRSVELRVPLIEGTF